MISSCGLTSELFLLNLTNFTGKTDQIDHKIDSLLKPKQTVLNLAFNYSNLHLAHSLLV